MLLDARAVRFASGIACNEMLPGSHSYPKPGFSYPHFDRSCAAAGPIFFWAQPSDRPYQTGRSKHWIKVKNRQHPAMDRVKEALPKKVIIV